jgi:hypothetical protein
MKIFQTIFLFIICISWCNCGYDQAPILVYSPPEVEEIKLDLYPKIAPIGYKLYIMAPDSFYFLNSSEILFADSIEWYSDSIRADTMYVNVPFGAKAGVISVTTKGITASTDIFAPIIKCNKDICVTEWDLNYSISEEDSYNWFTGAKWSYEVNHDTITILQETYGPNYTKRAELLFFYDSSISLPKFISGNYYLYGSGQIQFDIEKAIIKLFKFNIDGIIAGKIFSTANGYFPFEDVFWVDLSE